MNPVAGPIYAARWFMSAASMACVFILAVNVAGEPPPSASQFLLNALLLLVGPVIITGFWGAVLGSMILEPETRGMGRAALIGLVVAGSSFVSYLLLLSLCTGALAPGYEGDALKLFIMLLVYGTVWVGWLFGIVGAYAGALLYKRMGSVSVSAGEKIVT